MRVLTHHSSQLTAADWLGLGISLIGVASLALYGPLVSSGLQESLTGHSSVACLPFVARAPLSPSVPLMASLPLIAMWATAVLSNAPLSLNQRRAIALTAGALAWSTVIAWSVLLHRLFSPFVVILI